MVDDGVGLPPGWALEHSGGVGLSATQQRVAGLYPEGETLFSTHAAYRFCDCLPDSLADRLREGT